MPNIHIYQNKTLHLWRGRQLTLSQTGHFPQAATVKVIQMVEILRTTEQYGKILYKYWVKERSAHQIIFKPAT